MRSIADKGEHAARRFFLLLAASAAACAVCILIFGIRYESNDDAAMANIAAGAFGPQSQYLIFSNVFYGWLLKGLRLAFPSVSWYTPAALFLLVVAFAAAGSALLRRFGPRRGVAVWLIVVVLLGPSLWCSLQFTKTAAFLIAAGFLVMVGRLDALGWGFAGGAALALFGSMIRYDLFWPVAAIAAGAMAFAWHALGGRKEKGRAIAAVAAVVALCACVQAAGVAVMRADPGWAHYLDYNKARVELMDYKIYYASEETAFDFYDCEVYEAEYEIIRDWNTNDPDFFTIERYRALSDAIQRPSIGTALFGYFATLPRFLFSGAGMLFFAAFAAALPACDKKTIWFPLATAAVTFGGMLVISWAGRLIERVAHSLLLAAALLLLSCASLGEQSRVKKWKVPLCSVCTVFLLVGVLSLIPLRAQILYFGGKSTPPVPGASDKEHLYLLDTDRFDPMMGYDVWHARPEGTFSNIVFLGGWLSESPFQVKAMEDYGTRNPYRDCVGNERVLLAESVNIHDVSRYIMLHYDIDSRLTLLPSGFYRVET